MTFKKCKMGRSAAVMLAGMVAFAAPAGAQQGHTVVDDEGALMAQSGTGVVNAITVEGTQRIDPNTVRSYMTVKVGDFFDAGAINRSLKTLFATGLFADVTFRRNGDQLIIAVVENPVINRIAFEGNRKLKDEELEKEVTLKPRVIYTAAKVKEDVERITNLYRRSGYFAATATPKVIQQPQNRVDLVFEIVEGKTTEIRAIRFLGNKAFDDGDLRGVVRTRVSRWYSFLTTDDNYDPDRVALDEELLRRHYLKNGYADFRLLSSAAELTPDRNAFFLTFALAEGDRYKFSDIEVVSLLPGVTTEQLVDQVDLAAGDWYNSDAVDKAADTLTDTVQLSGVPFVQVIPRLNKDAEAKTIGVVFEMSMGPRTFVERIDITGNQRTEDSVIRREIMLAEGDAFIASKLRRSRTRIEDLDFFEKTTVETVPGSTPDHVNINVDVAEKSTGSLSLGAGYSTTYGILGSIGLKERNLLGKGLELDLNTSLSTKRSTYDISFTDPYFMGREVSAGADLFHTKTDLRDTSSYESKNTGGALRVGYYLMDNLKQSWKYKIDKTTISNLKTTASALVRSQEGTSLVSQISHTLAYDLRNSVVSPSEGYVVGITNDLAGLGGDAKFLRNSVFGTYYYPLSENVTLSVSGEAGHITGIGGRQVRLVDRFFLGGDRLRGFASYGVGPRDISTKDALGGRYMYGGTVEMSSPLGLPNEYQIKGRIFADMGSTWSLPGATTNTRDEKSLRTSVGFGMTWVSPMGPISLDYGVPLSKQDYDITENFRVNFGTRF